MVSEQTVEVAAVAVTDGLAVVESAAPEVIHFGSTVVVAEPVVAVAAVGNSVVAVVVDIFAVVTAGKWLVAAFGSAVVVGPVKKRGSNSSLGVVADQRDSAVPCWNSLMGETLPTP